MFFKMISQLSFYQGSIENEMRSKLVVLFPDYPRNFKLNLALGERNREEICFYKDNPNKCEGLWQIYSGGEEWRCIKGKDNFFCAIALFFYHIKQKMKCVFGYHCYKELINMLLN